MRESVRGNLKGLQLAASPIVEISPNELARGAIFCEINRTRWRDGRVAEGDGLLNRYTVKSRIGGSNPPLSAIDFAGFAWLV